MAAGIAPDYMDSSRPNFPYYPDSNRSPRSILPIVHISTGSLFRKLWPEGSKGSAYLDVEHHGWVLVIEAGGLVGLPVSLLAVLHASSQYRPRPREVCGKGNKKLTLLQ